LDHIFNTPGTLLYIMGWFSSSSDKEETPSTSFSDSGSSFSSGDSFDSGAALGAGGGGGGMSTTDMQQFAANIQQQALVQGIISDITEQSLEKCLTGRPNDSKLSGTQVACIHAATNKWMDTNEFMNGRMAAKAKQQGGGMMQ